MCIFTCKKCTMIKKVKTALEFTKNVFQTGALFETSRKVEIEICKYIPRSENAIVVEFGMGHGNITKEILNTISSSSKLYAFEVNKDFCEHVRKTIKDERLVIINESAEYLKKYVSEDVDSVIASIPFSFFSKEKGLGIIQDSYDVLASGSYYSQVLLSKFNFKKFQLIFDECELLKLPNLRLEYIYHCKKK